MRHLNTEYILTPYEGALISQAAYAKNSASTIGHWRFLDKVDLNDYGYAGVAYISEKNKQIIIAHRGTDTSLLSNIIADVGIMLNKKPKAQQLAYAFSERVRNNSANQYEIVEVGHSLGGLHAELNAIYFNSLSITFDSPGIGSFIENDFERYAPLMTSYLSTPNTINTAKKHVGKIYRIFVSHVDGNGHLISDLSQAFTKLLDVVDRPLYSAKSAVNKVINQHLDMDLQAHALQSLINSIDPNTGYPWLMREMQSWPSLVDLTLRRLNPCGYDLIAWGKETLRSHKQVVQQNRRYESTLAQLNNYKPVDFFIPALPKTVDDQSETAIYYTSYYQKALTQFDSFYNDNLLREQFISQLPIKIKDNESISLSDSKFSLWHQQSDIDTEIDNKFNINAAKCTIN